MAAHVRSTAPDAVLLNDPRSVLRRLELLRTLHRDGINSFNAYRADALERPERWPVFVRGEQDHEGPSLPLLHDPAELAGVLEADRERGIDLSRRLIVEYAESKSPDGLYRKYGAFRIGDRIYPRHIFFSRQWMVKLEPPPHDAAIAEEREFIEQGPDNERLMEIFERAGVQYGRIDYARVGAKLAVWEINTNPSVVDAATIEIGKRFPRGLAPIPGIAHALLEIAREGEGRSRIPLRGVRGVHPRWWGRLRGVW